jgi:hypothetical protein
MKLFTIDSSIARRIGVNLSTLRETFISLRQEIIIMNNEGCCL